MATDRRPARPPTDARPDRRTGRAPDRPVPLAAPLAAPRGATEVGSGSLLCLQALAGNRAVGLLTRNSWHPGTVPVQRRRVPDAAHTDPLIAPGGTDQAAHRQGLDRVLARAMSELSTADQAAARAAAAALAGSTAAYNVLPPAGRARLLAQALRSLHPDLVLGDPALIDTGPRPGTPDTANLATLVTNAAALMGPAVAGARDADLAAIFGPANVATVKSRYAAALARMNLLHGAGRIVTDRSGYNAEVDLGGLTNPNQIALSPTTIDTPANKESVITLVHEAMHAGVPSIDDRGYIDSPSFTTIPEADKLDNAAHYEVTFRRQWGLPGAYPGVVFVPAGTSVTVGGVVHSAPALTPLEQASRNASETVRAAWGMGLNMHSLWVRINLHRADWTGLDLTTTYSGAVAHHFDQCMPYWSKVQGLTVHTRPGRSAGGAGASTAPVTQIDIALSEGMVRLLARAMDIAGKQLDSAPKTTAFLAAHTSPAQRSAAGTVAQKTTLLLTALRRVVGEITGDVTRDVRVIKRMAAAPDYSDMLVPRNPASF